jgi:hypothetical protein
MINMNEKGVLKMTQDNPSVLDVLGKAFDDSSGKTVDLNVEHEVLRGVSPEMMEWWVVNQEYSDRYRTWYPQDHVSCKWEAPISSGEPLCVVVESIGEFSASPLRIRPQDPPGWSSISDASDRRVAWIHEELEETADGVKLHSTFRLPAKTPQKFLEAMRRHNIEEMARLPDFLPELYRQAVG